jgi:hypothetical protein
MRRFANKLDRKRLGGYLQLSLHRHTRGREEGSADRGVHPARSFSKCRPINGADALTSRRVRGASSWWAARWIDVGAVGTSAATVAALEAGLACRSTVNHLGGESSPPKTWKAIACTLGTAWRASRRTDKSTNRPPLFRSLSAAQWSRWPPVLSGLMAWGVVAGCSGAEARQAPLRELQLHLRMGRDIRLEEPVGVINVNPRVVPDRDGGFIVADSREGQIRIYSRTGDLEHHFGGHGKGPGEFGRIAAAGRLPSGLLVVADMGGDVTVFDSVGGKVLQTIRTPLAPLYNLTVLDERHVVLTGRTDGALTSPLVHVLDLQDRRLIRSFFRAPRPPRGLEGAYAFAGTADVAVRNDTAVVVWGVADTVYLYRLDGTPTGKVAMRSENFRMLDKPLPERGAPPVRFERWTESFSATSRVFWSARGFLVEYFDMVGHEPRWSLIHLARDGTVLFEIADIPKLLTPTASDSGLVFIKPGSELPNLWSIAYTRQ